MIELFYMFAELFQILIIYAFADKMLQKKYSIQRTMVGWLVLYAVYRILALNVNNKYINILLYYVFIVLTKCSFTSLEYSCCVGWIQMKGLCHDTQ